MNNLETKEKGRVAVEQQFLFRLSQIVELFPQYNISQHMAHIFRRKNEPQIPYFWVDSLSLRKIEEYYDELTSDLANIQPENED